MPGTRRIKLRTTGAFLNSNEKLKLKLRAPNMNILLTLLCRLSETFHRPNSGPETRGNGCSGGKSGAWTKW